MSYLLYWLSSIIISQMYMAIWQAHKGCSTRTNPALKPYCHQNLSKSKDLACMRTCKSVSMGECWALKMPNISLHKYHYSQSIFLDSYDISLTFSTIYRLKHHVYLVVNYCNVFCLFDDLEDDWIMFYQWWFCQRLNGLVDVGSFPVAAGSFQLLQVHSWLLQDHYRKFCLDVAGSLHECLNGFYDQTTWNIEKLKYGFCS